MTDILSQDEQRRMAGILSQDGVNELLEVIDDDDEQEALQNSSTQDFDKIYVIDTNIILAGIENIKTLSQDKRNLVVVPQIVSLELRKFKTDMGELGFHARNFNRVLRNSTVTETFDTEHLKGAFVETDDMALLQARPKYYYEDLVENDDRIIDLAVRLKEDINSEIILVSNDIDVRVGAILENVKAEPLKNDEVELEQGIPFKQSYEISGTIRSGTLTKTVEKEHSVTIPDKTSCVEFLDEDTGNRDFFINLRGKLSKIDEKELARQGLSPKNLGQKFFSALILEDMTDIIVCEAKSGTGKNAIALSSAVRLFGKNKDKYDKIIYMRNSINSVDKEAEIGFLPGDLKEKLAGFTMPLLDTIEAIIRGKKTQKKNWTKEEMEAEVETFINKHNLQNEFIGHSRGRTYNNSIIIVDEASNLSKNSMQTILTRTGKDCKIIVIGSNRQIDSVYLNKHNNGLTYLMSVCGQDNPEDVLVVGTELEKTVRSSVAEWADRVFDT